MQRREQQDIAIVTITFIAQLIRVVTKLLVHVHHEIKINEKQMHTRSESNLSG